MRDMRGPRPGPKEYALLMIMDARGECEGAWYCGAAKKSGCFARLEKPAHRFGCRDISRSIRILF